jgi:hypothetical protein
MNTALHQTDDKRLIQTALNVASELEPETEPQRMARSVIVELCKRVGFVSREPPIAPVTRGHVVLAFFAGTALGTAFVYLSRFAN